MNRLKSSLTIISAALLCSTTPLLAQQKRTSPHETVSSSIDGSLVTVVYGRPFMKDPKSGETRKIWGGLVPFGKVWRLGSDEATLLVTQKPLTVEGKEIPAGAFSMFLLPLEDGSAKLIISKQLGEWGAYTYDDKQDLLRVDLKKDVVPTPLEQFTIAVDKGEKGSGAGTLKFSWEGTSYELPFTVKK